MKQCEGCPWKKENRQESWIEYVRQEASFGIVDGPVHQCHEKNENTWDQTPRETLCPGSLKELKENKSYEHQA